MIDPLNVLAVVVLLTLPPGLYGAWRLTTLSRRHPDLTTLAERASGSRWLALEQVIAGFFSVMRLFHIVVWPNITTALLVVALIAPAIPNVRWAYLYLRDGFE